MHWHDCTWNDIEDMTPDERQKKVLFLVVGAVEQHGPHLPLATDFIYGEAIAEKVATLVPEVLLLPALPYGSVTAGRDFPGSVPIRSSTLMTLLLDIFRSLEKQGFARLVVYASHGGNTPVVETAMKEFAETGGTLKTYLISALDLVKDLVESVREGDEWGHACEIETSLMLHLFPDKVHMDRICPGCNFKGFQHGPRRIGGNWKEYCGCGIHGEARHASSEKGAQLADALVERIGQKLAALLNGSA